MQAQRNNLGKRAGRSVRVNDVVFHRPRPPLGRLASFTERQRRILVPHYKPIGSGRLVEQSRLKRKSLTSENFPRDSEKLRRTRDFEHRRMSESVTHARASSRQRSFDKFSFEVIECPQGEGLQQYRESKLSNFGFQFEEFTHERTLTEAELSWRATRRRCFPKFLAVFSRKRNPAAAWQSPASRFSPKSFATQCWLAPSERAKL